MTTVNQQNGVAVPAASAQTLISKLDLGHISVKYAKDFVRTQYGVSLVGRTKEQVIRAIAKARGI